MTICDCMCTLTTIIATKRTHVLEYEVDVLIVVRFEHVQKANDVRV